MFLCKNQRPDADDNRFGVSNRLAIGNALFSEDATFRIGRVASETRQNGVNAYVVTEIDFGFEFPFDTSRRANNFARV